MSFELFGILRRREKEKKNDGDAKEKKDESMSSICKETERIERENKVGMMVEIMEGKEGDDRILSFSKEKVFIDDRYETKMCVPEVIIGNDVIERIKTICKSASPNETMGFFVGYRCTTEDGCKLTLVKDIIAGPVMGYRASAEVTKESRGVFLKQILDKHPDCSEVGWWHSHPNFGCFLSGTDEGNHLRWYDNPFCIALVYDPIREEHAIFKWSTKRERFASYLIVKAVDDKLIALLEGKEFKEESKREGGDKTDKKQEADYKTDQTEKKHEQRVMQMIKDIKRDMLEQMRDSANLG